MRLFKFCNPEHNLFKGSRIRVGTLYGYRHIENSDLRDDKEGQYTFQLSFPERIELDRDWANLVLQRAIAFGETRHLPQFPGNFSVHIENLQVVKQTPTGVVVENTRVQIERHVPNCLIFCMSAFESANSNPFPRYKDHWSISEASAQDFGVRLGNLIFQQVKLSSFDEALSRRHSPATVPTLSLGLRHKRVIYRERELVITPDHRPSFDELLQAMADIPFVKPLKHESEQEYRFVYDLRDPGHIYPPKIEPVDINPNALTDLP